MAFTARTSTTTPSRPRSSSLPRSSCCCSSTCSSTSARSGRRRRSPASGCSLRSSRSSRSPSTAPIGRCSAAPTSSTTSRSCVKALFLVAGYVGRAAVDELHRRGRLLRGRVLLPAALLAPRHGRDGVGARPRSRSSSPSRLLSIPAYMLAAWRKRDLKSNEAGMKYYLLGVFASAVMLYGMSLLYGVTGSTAAHRHRRDSSTGPRPPRRSSRSAIVFVHRRLRVQGVGGAVPHVGARHLRGRADAGHRVPVGRVEGGRLRRAAAAGLRRVLRPAATCGQPMFWVLAALVDDRRQPRSPCARRTSCACSPTRRSRRRGYMLVPLAVAGDEPEAAKSALTRDRHLPRSSTRR